MLQMTPDDLVKFLEDQFPQIDHLGLGIEELDNARIRVRLPFKASQLRPGGTVSGPTVMGLADTTMYLMILARIGPVAGAVTTNLNISFLRFPKAADMLAEGKILKLGQRLAVGEVTIYSEGEAEPVAHATLTYSIPPREASQHERPAPLVGEGR